MIPIGTETNSREPRKQKINLEKVLASINTVCPKCGRAITPDKIRRVDFQSIERYRIWFPKLRSFG